VVKGQSNLVIASFLRNIFKYSLILGYTWVSYFKLIIKILIGGEKEQNTVYLGFKNRLLA